MKLILLLSWKNIWRTRKRSFAVIGSISVGVWALAFLFAFYNSIIDGYIRNAIQFEYSHVQIHNPQYRMDPVPSNYIQQSDNIESTLENTQGIRTYSSRTIISGIAATGRSNKGVEIVGIDPEQEASVTNLESLLVEGEYLTGARNPLLISQEMAEELSVQLRSKVILTFQDSLNNITAAAFRVDGIFESKSPRINRGVVYVRKGDLQDLAQLHQTNEIGILVNDVNQIPQVQSTLQSVITNAEVLSYRELAPEFDLITQQSALTKQIITLIIMLALLFGIINTMLMAVLERTKELGMLRSIGLSKSRVFNMVLLETLLMSLIGGPIGVILGIVTNLYFASNGIDLSQYADSLREYGYDSTFYPSLDPSQYPVLMVVVMITAFIGAIYPAIKAIKLNPVESIRKI